jgi:DNA-directed RNA polymerase specialized sigma24 family protein
MPEPRPCGAHEALVFGPSLKEIARALNVSAGAVRRDWRRAQPWLYREFSRSAL